MAAEELPGCELLQKVAALEVQKGDGSSVRFGSILETANTKRVMVLFIRHFFCGNCQEFVRRVSDALPPSSLPEDLSLIIMGCGAASLIRSYVELTRCPYPIYADPSTRIHQMLGMHRTLSLGTKSPEYIQHSLLTGVLKSIRQGVKRIGSGDVLAAGDLSVNGGEFLFTKDKDQGWTVPWCHRMRNSRGHVEVQQLRQVIGIQDGLSAMRDKTSHPRIKRSMSQRRQSWMNGLNRTQSKRQSLDPRVAAKMVQNDSHSTAVVHVVTG